MRHMALIIEDSQDDRDMYRRFLLEDAEREWMVLEAESGREAMELFAVGDIDLALVDYSLPGRNGLAVLQDLREHNAYAAIVMITGQGNEAVAKEAIRRGAHDYLIKSQITPEGLQLAMRNALEHAAAMRKMDEQREDLECFAKVLAHDLKAPMRKISCFSSLMNEDLKNGNIDGVGRYADIMERSAGQMIRLIESLSAYNRVDMVELTFAPVNMGEVAELALEQLSEEFADKSAQASVDALPEVVGNNELLVQLLQNLLDNAVKYNEAQPPQVRVGAEEGEETWTFAVTDNGIGVPAEYRDFVFQPLQRLHGEDRYSGSGLGLAICQKIVRRHGGVIWCEPAADGSGATIRFTLPKPSKHTPSEETASSSTTAARDAG